MAICPKCNWWERLCHCQELELFNTTKDQLYNFTDVKNFREPIEVHGKDHWKKLLKQNGLIDDVDVQTNPDKLVKDPRPWKPTDKKWVRDQILSELHDKGLYHKLVKRRK